MQMRVLGFMSGTSLDGVDAAVIDTDGHDVLGFGPSVLAPFDDADRAVLLRATAEALALDEAAPDTPLTPPPPSFAKAAAVILTTHVRAARLLGDVAFDLVGFHGQTVLHRPARRLTIQLGDPAALATALGVRVVADLRQADLAAGGQGAPLVPAYHVALARRARVDAPVAFLNLGGVANLTWLGSDGQVIAFDTGPANGLIDLMVQHRGAGRYDDGGRLAAAGRVDQAALATLLALPYFAKSGARSLDRHDFPLDAVGALSTPDAAATLVAFTARSVALAAAGLPAPPSRWLVCGGGRHNPALMSALSGQLGRCDPVDALGLRGDMIEAEAMAFLAARSVLGLPITFPGTTGAPAAMTGGVTFTPAPERAA